MNTINSLHKQTTTEYSSTVKKPGEWHQEAGTTTRSASWSRVSREANGTSAARAAEDVEVIS